ncbi:2-methylaconitate cis-trans isomerase PrpF [Paraglaciecola aquimarina]|uniref:2-methylaconitate cis-trans isomerase PrpF n=1 Tax=Paraglaciecola algarum TaxID=3050085 RepID=A0ABS9D2P4_9ALTE|nr:2-methylaconitate cis-trans isomerase PrpF [Paraglaciecola sp. G1-23]MCF2947151.1 2-methylaconitate cis-trans isomerase PrpF [Paraglaciecola sp. G1-23]
MDYITQLKIPATYMRGGTSKGVFFNLQDLPKQAQAPGKARDDLLLRVIGSPDPYEKQIDGMGGASSSTSKAVILSKSDKAEHDVNYLFGQISIDKPKVDWSGNCGNLTAAVGSFAVTNQLVDNSRIPQNGIAIIRIWQENIQKSIVAHVPIQNGQVVECGHFELDGVTFPSAEIKIEFIQPVDASDILFPTGNLVDQLDIPDVGSISATMINAGIPTIFVNAVDIGYLGTESQENINNDPAALQKFEKIRAYGALKMGLIENLDEANNRLHTPKIVYIGPSTDYQCTSGKQVSKNQIDLCVRALSMGKLHHAMMGTAAVSIASASVIQGTIVNQLITGNLAEKARHSYVVFGHPSGTLKVGAQAAKNLGKWTIEKVTMSRSARVLMEGKVLIPHTWEQKA